MRMLIAAVLLISGCASNATIPTLGVEPGTFAVDVSSERGVFTIWVTDHTGLVVGARKLLEAGRMNQASDVTAVAAPETNEVAVGWIGGVCYHGPTITIDRAETGLMIVVRPDEGSGPGLGKGCIDLGLYYGVVLTLTEPVEQSDLTVQLAR